METGHGWACTFGELGLKTVSTCTDNVEAYTHKAHMHSKKILAKFQFRYLPDKPDPGNDNNDVYYFNI